MAKICVKSPRFGTNENVEITVGVLENLRQADLLLRNDLFKANSKLKDQIEVVNFDVSLSPAMDKAATSSESMGNQMSEMFSEQAETVTSNDQIVESGVTVVNSETVVPSSDPIEIAAVNRSQSKHTSEVGDGDTGPVRLSDETNRMLRHGYD